MIDRVIFAASMRPGAWQLMESRSLYGVGLRW